MHIKSTTVYPRNSVEYLTFYSGASSKNSEIIHRLVITLFCHYPERSVQSGSTIGSKELKHKKDCSSELYKKIM